MIKPDKIRCGIFTNDYDTAQRVIGNIKENNINNIEFYRKGKTDLNLRLKDGTDYIWIRPIDMSRGYRCSKAMIDLAIDYDTIQRIIKPICIYCDEQDYQTFDSREHEEYMKATDLIELLKSMVAIFGNKVVARNDDGRLLPITDIWFGKVPIKFNDGTREDIYDYGFEIV